MILFKEIAWHSKYLSEHVTGHRNTCKKFLEQAKKFFQKQQRAYKSVKNLYICSFFYDTTQKTLNIFCGYKSVKFTIQVIWSYKKPQGLCYACENGQALPASIINFLNRCLMYSIPSEGITEKGISLIPLKRREDLTAIQNALHTVEYADLSAYFKELANKSKEQADTATLLQKESEEKELATSMSISRALKEKIAKRLEHKMVEKYFTYKYWQN